MELAQQEAQQGVRNWKERFAVAQEQAAQAVAQVEELHGTVEMLTASQKQHKTAARSFEGESQHYGGRAAAVPVRGWPGVPIKSAGAAICAAVVAINAVALYRTWCDMAPSRG